MRALLVLCVVGVGVVYGANPNYSYHVKIDDAAHANFQEKAETRKGPDAVGFYSVVDPNGSLRTVEYTADDRGFNPRVTYSHPGAHVYNHAGVSAISGHAYAPAYVQDNRVQIVDKFTGPPPAINIAPFALPAPSFGGGEAVFSTGVGVGGPLVVPAPVRAPPPSHLIAQAQGVEYAPAYMPPVQAFVQQQEQVYLPPPQQVAVAAPVQHVTTHVAHPVRTYLPPPPAPVVHQVAAPVSPQLAYYHQPFPQVAYPQVHQGSIYPQVQVTTHVTHPVRTYLPPPPVVQKTYLPPVEPVRTYLPPVTQEVRQEVVAVERPSLEFSLPKKVTSLEKVTITDSYAVAPVNTISDPNSPVYPESIGVVSGVKSTYGPPNYTPGTPIGLETFVERRQPVAVAVKKPVTVSVSVVGPPPQIEEVREVVHHAPRPQVHYAPAVAVPAPQVHYAPAPVPQVHYQESVAVAAPQYHREVVATHVHAQPAAVAVPVAHKVLAAPSLGLYAGAVGYHTQTSGPAQYQHSYGTQGFQVTSSRNFNKVVHHHQPAVAVAAAVPVRVQPQVIHQQVAQPVVQYAPQYIPAPAAPVVQVHHAHQQVAVPVAQPAISYGPPTGTYLPPVAAPPAVYGPVHTSAAAVAAAVPIGGKKQNPLTFSYGYEQGGAKVSHSYSGSGW